MRKHIILLLLLLVITPTTIFSAKAKPSKKTAKISRKIVKPQPKKEIPVIKEEVAKVPTVNEFEELKKEFYTAFETRPQTIDYNILFTTLSKAVPAKEADKAMPFLLDISKKLNVNLSDLPATASVKNPVIYQYLENSPDFERRQKLAIYEKFQEQTPSVNYVLGILWVLAPYQPSPKPELSQKFDVYLSQLDKEIAQLNNNYELRQKKGLILVSARKFKDAITALRPLLDAQSEDISKPHILFLLIGMHRSEGDLAAVLDDLFPYIKSVGTDEMREECGRLYLSLAELSNNNATETITYASKGFLLLRNRSWTDYSPLRQKYKEIAKQSNETELLLSNIQSAQESGLKTFTLMGAGEGYYEKKEYAKAIPFLKEALDIYPTLYTIKKQESDLAALKLTLAHSYNFVGDYLKASTYYKQLPNSPEAQYALGLIWINNLKSKKNAKAVISKFKKTNKEYYTLLTEAYNGAFTKKRK